MTSTPRFHFVNDCLSIRLLKALFSHYAGIGYNRSYARMTKKEMIEVLAQQDISRIQGIRANLLSETCMALGLAYDARRSVMANALHTFLQDVLPKQQDSAQLHATHAAIANTFGHSSYSAQLTTLANQSV